MPATPVTRIDRRKRVVHSRSGAQVPYDRLLIATGSRPVISPLPGAELAGVVTFRDLQDVDAARRGARAGRNAVVIGGGLLGHRSRQRPAAAGYAGDGGASRATR